MSKLKHVLPLSVLIGVCIFFGSVIGTGLFIGGTKTSVQAAVVPVPVPTVPKQVIIRNVNEKQSPPGSKRTVLDVSFLDMVNMRPYFLIDIEKTPNGLTGAIVPSVTFFIKISTPLWRGGMEVKIATVSINTPALLAQTGTTNTLYLKGSALMRVYVTIQGLPQIFNVPGELMLVLSPIGQKSYLQMKTEIPDDIGMYTIGLDSGLALAQ